MTARQPRRTRRRAAPGANLPRPASSPVVHDADGAAGEASASPIRTPRRQVRHREHHVTTDYSHVHRDLLTVLVVGLAVLGFIIGMSFVI